MVFSARLGGVGAKKSPAALKSIKTIINISPPQAKKKRGGKSAAAEIFWQQGGKLKFLSSEYGILSFTPLVFPDFGTRGGLNDLP